MASPARQIMSTKFILFMMHHCSLILLIFFILSFCVLILLCKDPVDGDTITTTSLRKLRQVQVIFRHGDRAPLMKAPIDPETFDKNWTDGISVLTDEGKQRAFKLGQYIRKRYNGFLKSSYSPQEISVETSSDNRTIETALIALAGLFPVTNRGGWNTELIWQPIPIRTIDAEVDNAPCPRWKQLQNEHLTTTDFARRINNENKELYLYVHNHTGYNVNNFKDICLLFDTLTLQKSHGYPVPKWSDSVWDKMAALSPLVFDSRVLVPTKEAKRIYVGPLLTKMMQHFDAVGNMEGNESTKMHWYAGHDYNIAGFLGALDLFETHYPPFTSAVFIELYEQQTSSKAAQSNSSKYFIKIFYHKATGEPAIEMKIRTCADPCPLDQFKNVIQDFIIDDEEWTDACGTWGASKVNQL